MRVLVPIDDTRESEAALTEAVRLIAGNDGSIILVTVGELAETSDEARDVLGRRLEEIAERLAPLPVVTRIELAGDPVQGILDVADEEHADRIVMATEREGFWEALLQGHRVSEDLDSDASMPVRVLDMRKTDVN